MSDLTDLRDLTAQFLAEIERRDAINKRLRGLLREMAARVQVVHTPSRALDFVQWVRRETEAALAGASVQPSAIADECPACGRSTKRHPGYVIGNHWLESAYERICAGEAEDDVLADYDVQRVSAPQPAVATQSCVHCASERISQLSFDVWECEDCGREFTFDWKPSGITADPTAAAPTEE